MITKDEYLQGFDELYKDDYTEELDDNTDILIKDVNEFLKGYTGTIKINSGYRPKTRNDLIPHASKTSLHLSCLAIDLNDPKGELWQYVLNNLDKAKVLGLFFEHPNWTRTKFGGWLHIQKGQPRSGRRIFVPSTAPPFDSQFWNGKYDSKFDVKPKG